MAFSMDYGTGFEMGGSTVEQIVAPENHNKQDNITASGTAHTGSYSLRLQRVNGQVWIAVPTTGSPTDLYVGVWIQLDSEVVAITRVEALTDGDDIGIHFAATGDSWTTDAYVAGVKVATGSVGIRSGEWGHLQVRFHLADAGHIATKVDGLADVDYSGDTKSGGATEITHVRLYLSDVALGSSYAYFDDFCFGTGGWPGDIRFEPLLPNADTATINWDGSDGNQVDNYALVDEVPPSDADYVESVSNGDQDKYDFEDFTITNKDPIALVLWARAKKDEADAHQLKLIIDDGTEDVGAAQDLLTSYKYIHRVDTTKPSGGAWTDAALDALEVGVESVIV
jgi:hypothetical protein